jgi:hypothetical protein
LFAPNFRLLFAVQDFGLLGLIFGLVDGSGILGALQVGQLLPDCGLGGLLVEPPPI